MALFVPHPACSPNRTITTSFHIHRGSFYNRLVPNTYIHLMRKTKTTLYMQQKPLWRPEGRLCKIVEEKELAMALLENTISSRPDHPLNLRLAFMAPKATNRVARTLRKGQGSLCVVGEIKRYQNMKNMQNIESAIMADELPTFMDDFEECRIVAAELENAGVECLIVNTDRARFGTTMEDLKQVYQQVRRSSEDPGIPIIRRDFIIHPLQIAEAVEAGAAAVVVIAGACLVDLEDLLNTATLMGLETIVECHTEVERDLAIEAGATMFLLNNYNWATGQLIPGTAERLREGLPEWIQCIAMGGIRTATEAWKMMDIGFDAVCIGTTLLRSRRRSDFVAEIKSQKRAMDAFMFQAFGFDPDQELKEWNQEDLGD